MPNLTAAEKKWLKKVQKVLDECPSERIAFYASGDKNIFAYDFDKYDEITAHQDRGTHDFCSSVKECDASFNAELTFNNRVESTSA